MRPSKAALIARSLYEHNIEVRIKADKSPVTEADVRCEIAIREILETRFPTYGFFGEETGSRGEDAEYLWLVDPIDGTKAFIREYPMFSTQIALMRRGELVLGVSSAPVYGELAYAERGRGAYLNGQGPRRQPGLDPGVRDAVLGKHEVPRDRTSVEPLRRARRAAEPYPRLRRFPALPFAGGGKDRRGGRIGCEHPGHCRLRGDRHRGGRPLHGTRRRTDHIALDLGARHQRSCIHAAILEALGPIG